ncbi:MAG: indole-3-glycerol-phosphate synthase TrpC, partial [Eudoraea sp.]|nr:indole-3-glycerol-phosphate synthase TrpC [Eudoraea sp.]
EKAYRSYIKKLIAAVLSPTQIKKFSELASSLHLEILLEVHNQDELDRSPLAGIQMVGVNNRNLKTFEVNLDTSRKLAEGIPADFVKVSESGLSNIAAIRDLNGYGYQGFLIGENFMKTDDPGRSALDFITNLKK